MYSKLLRAVALAALVFALPTTPAHGQVVRDMTISKVGGTGSGDFAYYGSSSGTRAYSFATTSCNEGNVNLAWGGSGTSTHPVIAQNMFRVDTTAGRVTQLGYSWLKHGFCAVNENSCGSCQGTSCSSLGIGCADTYGSGLNDGSSGKGKADVDGTTGAHNDSSLTSPSGNGTIRGRLQVSASQMGLSGSRYICEAQYVYAIDHQAGNGRNNVSWREVNTSSGSGGIDGFGHTIRRYECAVEAWQELDSGVTVVEVVNTDEPTQIDQDQGHYVLGCKTTSLGGGLYRYEYALQNLTSDQSASSFAVPLCSGIIASDFYFHDVDHHSGSPYSDVDWAVTQGGGELVWEVTEDYGTNVNANALRWGTLYNFGFTADSAPVPSQVAIGLFKPGPTSALTADIEAPCTPSTCTSPSVYCTGKLNSQGCVPSIGSTGAAALTGPDDFIVTATGIVSGQYGFLLWSLAPNSLPFYGGTLCLAPPLARGSILFSGGSSAPDCSGMLAHHLTQSDLASFGRGTILHTQFWYRDPWLPELIGLTNGLAFEICP
ncbi:MAG: hypothetical protein E2O39_01435 [Planctomycetota bacterium]|nr:MAG: hypothetical protein E2O39_01435 [Planctomycetota bacterium]